MVVLLYFQRIADFISAKGARIMDIIEELQNYKRNLGVSNEMISEGAHIPLPTVQKIFSGVTKAPRRKTILALKSYFRSLYQDTPDITDSIIRYDTKTTDTSSNFGESIHIFDPDKKAAGSNESNDAGWIIKDAVTGTTNEPALTFTRQGSYTIDDFYALPDGIRVELIDGILYQFNAPSLVHQTIVFEIARQLDTCAAEHDCKVLLSPVNVQLDRDSKTMVEPDISVLCDRGKAINRCIYGAPDFVLEVLSPSTRKRDLTIKVSKYEQAGCREYWIVDPESRTVFVYFFEDERVIYQYTFNDKIPVRISNDKCIINFQQILDSIAWFK